MLLAREGGAGYNKVMKNYYRIMFGAGVHLSVADSTSYHEAFEGVTL
jgi:hypothetical protein